jgi:NitT/TauT family transport system substrate-binding protein
MKHCLLVVSILFFSVTRTGPVDAESITIAYSAISGAMAPLWVAQDESLFKSNGLDVQLLYIGGGSVATSALLAGDVQFVRLGANAVIQASLMGAELKIIANTINTLVFSLMVKPEIKSPSDLKGRRIGLTNRGGSTDFALDLALRKWRLERGRDVMIFYTGGMPQLLGALTSGQLDGGVISPPTNLRALKLGLKELVDFGDLGIMYLNSPLATTNSFIKTHRDVVLRLLRSYCQGIQRVRTDRRTAIRVLAKYTKVQDPDILAELYRIYGVKFLEPVPYVSLEGVDAVLRSLGKDVELTKASDFIDNTLLRELEQEGLFRGFNR